MVAMVGNSYEGDGGKVVEFFPHDILINILKRLPVKSLARFNCVSKDWAKLFKTPHFIAQHLHHSARRRSFLLLQRTLLKPHQNQSHHFVSSCLIGPDLKVHNSQFLDFTSPAFRIVGSCNGLLCLRDADYTLSLCNPATRQIKEVPRTLIDVNNLYYIGFGFSPSVDDFKIVKISLSGVYDEEDRRVVDMENVQVSRVEVYSLTTGYWKEIVATNLRNLRPMSNCVAVDGSLFWLANMNSSELEDTDVEFVISFDIGKEAFSLLEGPWHPASPTRPGSNKLTAYDNKLAMFCHFITGNFESSCIELWRLDNTRKCVDSERWIKLYRVGPFSRILYPLGIWNDEFVCLEELSGHMDDHNRLKSIITLFNPCSNELRSLPAHTDEYCYVHFNYEESLVQVANIQHEQ